MSIRQLPESLQKKSETELNEVPSRVQEDLQHIKDWIAMQPHLTVRTEDNWLLCFLRGCKFSLERTKEKLDMFHTMRALLPEFYADRDPFRPELQEVLKLGLFLPLPNTTDSAEARVVLFRCKPADPTKIPFINVLKVSIMIMDILMYEDDNFVIGGQEALGDMSGLLTNHVVQLTPSLAKKAVMCLQNSYPLRPTGIYFINTPPITEMAFNVMRPMLNDKIKERIHFYNENNLSDLYQLIPRSVLPSDYGGSGGSIEELTVQWQKKVESYKDWFIEDDKYRSNESLRPGRSFTSDQLFGVEGSFRKLTID